MEEITCLRQITNENDSFLITEKSGEDITTAWGDRTYFLRQINRKEPFFLIHFIKLFFQAHAILKKEKPDCIISTGALMTYPVCLLGKMRKIHIIYIQKINMFKKSSPKIRGTQN